MSKKSTAKLREEFENKYGFTPLDRNNEVYKHYWRRFKKDMRGK